MESPSDSKVKALPKAVRVLWILLAITAVVSLLYAIQYYLGGPLRLPVVSQFYSIDLNPDGSLAAAGAADGQVRVWDVPPDINTAVGKNFNPAADPSWPVRIFSGSGAPVLAVGFTPDGANLIAVSRDGTVRAWDVADGSVTQEFDLGLGPLADVDLAGDRQSLVAVDEDGVVSVWDVTAEQQIQSIPAGDNRPKAIAINRDGTLAAAPVTSVRTGGAGTGAQIWNVQTGELVQTLEPYCEDGTSTTEDACKEAVEDWFGHDKEITSLAFSPDDKLLATGSADTTIVFWDLETGEAASSSVGHWAAVSAMVFNEPGDFLLSGGRDYKSRTLRVAGGRSTAIYEGHLATVNGVAFGPQEDTIITVSDDGSLRVWGTANQYTAHIEWSRLGLQPAWGRLFGLWMLVSGVLALVSLWGLVKLRLWAHLLALTVFLIGPILVLGLPLLEVLTYPLPFAQKLQIAWPLLFLAAWYIALLVVLKREPVAVFYEAPQDTSLSEQITISQRTLKTRFGIYSLAVWIALMVILFSILRRFNLDIAFMGSWLEFIMRGSFITFYVSAISILLAVVLALLGALGRLSKNPIANAGSGFYISLIRGTPLLVQIYIWYLGLPRLGIVLDPRVAGILALSVNYGAYMTEIFRAGIQAVSIGQREAAQALGMSGGQTFRRIILPQAFRIVIPPIGNEFIAMMKDSSLVSVMAVMELTWRANKVGRQYFRGMETFIIAAAFYWILTVVFQLLQGRLEEYMARGERR
jgi:polar amino acid transport system permease protein